MHELRDDRFWILLTADPLDVGEATRYLRDERAGAIDLFLGTTRRWTDDDETSELEYEAYAPMVVEEMQRIAREAGELWPIARLAAHHRTGHVAVMESSVLVGVSSPHRAEAFEACRFLIDQLKERLPIWKREKFASGDQKWVTGSRAGERNAAVEEER